MQERIPKVAIHSSGRETDFSIQKEDDPSYKPNLSAANYGDISRVTASVERGEKTRGKGLVLKRYKGSETGEWGGNWHRDFAVKAYNAFKEMGLKNIPTTFRPVGTVEVAMTDFNSGGNIALSGNEISEKRKEKIESFVNFEQTVEAIKTDLIKAALYGIRVLGDSYFFVVPKEGTSVKVKIVIADLEGADFSRNATQLDRLNDLKKIEEVYKGSVDHFKSALGNNKYFTSKEYIDVLRDKAEKILLPLDISFEIQKYIAESKESIVLDPNASEREIVLLKVLSGIRPKMARNLYATIVQEKAVHMGYDMTSLPKIIEGSNGHAAYMIYRSENGSSFGVDTLFLGYKRTDGIFQVTEVAETRREMQITGAKVENGNLIINIETNGENIRLEHSLDVPENFKPFSDLQEVDKNLFEMYKNMQIAYQDPATSKIFHGAVKG